MADCTPEQEKEFEFRLRYEQEQAANQPKQQTASPDAVSQSTNEIMSGGLGATAGAMMGQLPVKIINGMVKDPSTGKWMAVENYARQMAQGKYYGGQNYDQVWDNIRKFNADPSLGPELEKQAMANRTTGQKVLANTPKALRGALTAPLGMLGRGVVGLGAGIQGADAMNRWNSGDVSGSVISGLGALGSAAAMIPHPIARIGGTAVGVGAEALNSYLDSLKNKPAMASGGQVKPRSKAHAAAMHLMSNKKKHFQTGGAVFNPQGDDYDYQTALAHGMGPTGTGENQGHWGSVAQTSDDERQLHDLPKDSYVILKGKSHPTFYKAESAEEERGFKIVKHGDRYYSVPK
jgi:hypothetical protein